MAQKKNAETLVKEALLPGEKICWQGKAVPFKLLENDTKKRLLARWIGGTAACVAMGFIYLSNNGSARKEFIVLVLALLVAMMVAPMFEMCKVQKYRYFLTDRRAIAVAQNGMVHCLGLEYVDDVQVLRNQTAGDCLVLGSAMMRDLNKQLRWLTCHPRTSTINLENGMGMGMVFYSVKNAEEAKAILKKGYQG